VFLLLVVQVDSPGWDLLIGHFARRLMGLQGGVIGVKGQQNDRQHGEQRRAAVERLDEYQTEHVYLELHYHMHSLANFGSCCRDERLCGRLHHLR
jgi:hypothetical protein